MLYNIPLFIGSAISILSIYLLLPIIIFVKIFGVNLYKINRAETVSIVLKKLPKRSSVINEGDNREWIWGWPYIGYVTEKESNSNIRITIFTTNKFYSSLVKNEENISKKNKTFIVPLYYRTGTYAWLRYRKRECKFLEYIDRTEQTNIVDNIIKNYKQNDKSVCWIHGMPGSGKSTIPILLAKKIKGSLCLTFNPTNPGDNIELVYNSVCPKENKPLIIVFEECDKMIHKIHENRVVYHKNIPTQVSNKTDLNTFFDWIDRGSYLYLIIIMTSNIAPEEIDKLDPSYLRDGRVNLRINL